MAWRLDAAQGWLTTEVPRKRGQAAAWRCMGWSEASDDDHESQFSAVLDRLLTSPMDGNYQGGCPVLWQAITLLCQQGV